MVTWHVLIVLVTQGRLEEGIAETVMSFRIVPQRWSRGYELIRVS